MKKRKLEALLGGALLAAALALTALFVVCPRVTPEANMRYAAETPETADPDMAELLTLLNGE